MTDIVYNTIPTPNYVPGVYVEFAENVNQNTIAVVPPKILIMGQMLSSGTAQVGVATRVFSADQVGQLCGRGSMLHQMAKKSFLNAPYVPTYILPEGDVGGGTKATVNVSVTGTATVAGEIDLYVGDTRYAIPVALGATGASLATAIATAIEADTDRYMDAAVDGSTTTQVDLTARHKGVAAGHIPVAVSRYDNESVPAGLVVTVSSLTAGTSEPDFTTAIANLGDDWYPTIVMPYLDNTNLNSLKTELLSRWGGVRQIEGSAFGCIDDTLNNEITFAGTRNDFLFDPLDCHDTLSPPYNVAAGVCGLYAARPNPALPLQRVTIQGILAKSRTSGLRKAFPDRNSLLAGGISTLAVADDGTVMVERLTTTYRTNQYGAPDTNYFDQESVSILGNIRFSTRIRFLQKYGQSLLGEDGSESSDNDLVVTPSVAEAEYVSLYIGWQKNSWVEGGAAFTQFVADLRAQINSTDPTRLDSTTAPNLMNKLCVVANQIQFIR